MKKSKPEKKKPAAKGAAKKPAAKAAAKPVKKAAVKAAPKAAKKVAAKAAPKKAAKPVAKKPVKAAVKAAPKAVKKEAPKAKAAVKEPVKVKAPAVAPAPVKKEEVKAKAPAPVKEAPAPKVKGAKAEKAAKVVAPVEVFPALDPSLKRPAKPFFLEVKPGVERVIKRGDKSAATQGLDIQARRKGPAAEESAEELAERIERELQTQSFSKRNRMRPQMCTKCGINAVAPRFTIDRELGYCDSCAEILRLGETKEARRMEFNLALKKEEGAEEGAEPEDGPAPDEVEDVPDVEE